MKRTLPYLLALFLSPGYSSLAIPYGFSNIRDTDQYFSADFHLQGGAALPSTYWSGRLDFWVSAEYGFRYLDERFSFQHTAAGSGMGDYLNVYTYTPIGFSGDPPQTVIVRINNLYGQTGNSYQGNDFGWVSGTVYFDGQSHTVEPTGKIEIFRNGINLPYYSTPETGNTVWLSFIGLASLVAAAKIFSKFDDKFSRA